MASAKMKVMRKPPRMTQTEARAYVARCVEAVLLNGDNEFLKQSGFELLDEHDSPLVHPQVKRAWERLIGSLKFDQERPQVVRYAKSRRKQHP